MNHVLRDLNPLREDLEDSYRSIFYLETDDETSRALQRVLRLIARGVELNQYISGYLFKCFSDSYYDVLGNIYYILNKIESFI